MNPVIDPKYLLHAYVIEGAYELVLSELRLFFEQQLNMATTNNPDLLCQQSDTFTIASARAIRDRSTRKAVHGRKCFVLSFEHATHEAQNALLKLFEEPAANTHFFVVVPTREVLLPTLLSRCIVVPTPRLGSSQKDAQAFLAANSAGRLSMLKDMIEGKDKKAALEFLNELEEVLYRNAGAALSAEAATFLRGLQKLKSYLGERSPSLKMILEHVAATAPVSNKDR